MKSVAAESAGFRRAAAVLALILTSCILSPANAAEEPCGLQETIVDCLGRRHTAATMEATDVAKLKVAVTQRATAMAAVAGADDLSVADLASLDKGSLRGFLETFLAQIDGVSTSGNEAELKVVYNARNQKVSAEAILHQGEVNDAVLQAYPEDAREDLEKSLNEKLGDADDIEAKIVLNYCRSRGDQRFGRRVKDYADFLRPLVEESITPTLAKPEVQEALRNPGLALGSLMADGPLVGNMTWGELKATGDIARIEEVRAILLSTAPAEVLFRVHQGFKREIKRSGIANFYKLVANQPQIYLELGGRIRDEAVGPDSWAAKFVWEMPQGRNVNKLIDYCRESGFGPVDLACFQQYMTLQETKASLHAKPRWKLEIKGAGIQPWDFRDPVTAAVKIDEPSDTKATLAASYSRVLRFVQVKNPESGELEDVEASRIDFEAAGEYVDNEEVFQRRIKATLTLTNRLNDNFDAALSFVWASDPEFRDTVDKDFSATAGIRFKVRNHNQES